MFQWVKGQIVIHPYNGMVFSNKKREWTIDTQNDLNESQKHYTEWKKPVSKFMCFRITFIWLSQNKTNDSDGEQIKVCQRLGKRRWYVYKEITVLGVVVMELFYLDCGDGYKNLYVCYNSQNCIPTWRRYLKKCGRWIKGRPDRGISTAQTSGIALNDFKSSSRAFENL